MSKGSKVKLSQKDWDTIFKYREIKLGETVLKVKQLTLAQIHDIIESFSKLAASGKLKGDPLDPLNIPVWVSAFPEILSSIINVEVEDVRRMPASLIVKIVLDIMDNEEELVKNLDALLTALREKGWIAVEK